MKSSSTQYLKKQSGESNLVQRSCKGRFTAKKRERESIDKDAGLVLEKPYLQEKSENKAKINSLMSEVSSFKQQHLKWKVDQLLCKNDKRPLQALWEALNDKATPGNELPMAIVMDPRCGIERRVEKGDRLVDREGWHMDNSTPLMMAVLLHRNDVEALLAAGADPSARDDRGHTSYLAAATYGNVTAMDLLLQYDADPLAVNDSGYSALHAAALGGHAQAIQVLVELGASTEAVGGGGYSPLLQTGYLGDVPSIVALLDKGANLEAEAENRWTPLASLGGLLLKMG